jgi:hypothetical protein
MPKTKQFESFSFSPMPQIVHLSMEEVAGVFYGHVVTVLKYLDQGEVVAFEVPINEQVVRIRRVSSSCFELKELGGSDPRTFSFDGMELLNWLFKTAPFISLVGIEKGGF